MRVSDYDDAVAAPGPNHELTGAEELISDLTALLEAGLVVVHEPRLGPARYGIAPAAPDERRVGVMSARPRPARIRPYYEARLM
jgi:hypothetical protein